MQYREEIDGLRALAVLPVILFHAGFEWFSGGFIGVDVFFVISGYLITTIIITNMTKGNFSLINFYERRARRILPALFFVMLICLPFAWFFLNPSELKDFGGSLVAVSTFTSNILFWKESDYFATAAELKPLLHTWSLAVEEQYYVLFPIFLMIVWRIGLMKIVLLLVIVFFLSLSLAHWGALNHPNAAFYLLPTRGWELLCGVFASIYLYRSTKENTYFKNNLLSIAGLAMIAYSIFWFDETTPFPSLYALIPTIGTVLIIIYAVPNTFSNWFLSLGPIVGIGLISYSAYLWHQPILAFAKHGFGEHQSEIFLLFLCILSLILAWFSWKFIEAPFRDAKIFNRKSIFHLALIGTIFFSAIGSLIHFTNGLEKLKILTYSNEEQRNYKLVSNSSGYDFYESMYSDYCKLWARDPKDLPQEEFNECLSRFGSPVVILGDSHAMSIYNIFARSKSFEFVVGLAQGGCRPHLPLESCHYENSKDFLTSITEHQPLVIYHQSGSHLFTDKYDLDLLFINKDLDYLKSNVAKVDKYLISLVKTGSKVIWLGPYTDYGYNPSRNPTEKPKKILSQTFDTFYYLDRELRKAISVSDLYDYVSFQDLFPQTSEVIFDECLIWFDEDHFSICGEKLISESANWSIFLHDE